MSESILSSTKKVLGLEDTYTAFDLDVTMHINTVLMTLNQLGIGPEEGFAITDATETWADFIGDDIRLNAVKTYVYLRVRLLFDPPSSSYLINALKEQQTEIEWRLSVHREGKSWKDPSTLTQP